MTMRFRDTFNLMASVLKTSPFSINAYIRTSIPAPKKPKGKPKVNTVVLNIFNTPLLCS